MAEPKHRFTLHIPMRIWERIKALATRNRRPITQEILLAIEEHLGNRKRHDRPPDDGDASS